MKTTIKQVTTITIFVLLFLVGNVNAKGTELDALNQVNIEETLEIENWMLNDNLWDIVERFVSEKANEAYLELESWMTNESIWETNKRINFEAEADEELIIEYWMVNEKAWNK